MVVFEQPPRPPIVSSVIEIAHAKRPRPNSADDEIVRRVRADADPSVGARRHVRRRALAAGPRGGRERLSVGDVPRGDRSEPAGAISRRRRSRSARWPPRAERDRHGARPPPHARVAAERVAHDLGDLGERRAGGGRSSTRSTIPVDTTCTAVSNIDAGSGSRSSTAWPRACSPAVTLAASCASPPLLLSTTTRTPRTARAGASNPDTEPR